MTIPGPKPLSTHLKLLKGNPGKRPLNMNEPKTLSSFNEKDYSSHWLGRWDDFRTFKWIEVIEYPEVLMDKTQKLLAIAA
jgi:hypothetical protein